VLWPLRILGPGARAALLPALVLVSHIPSASKHDALANLQLGVQLPKPIRVGGTAGAQDVFSISDQANDFGIRIRVEQVHPLDCQRLENLGAVQQPLHQENHLEIALLQPVGFAQGLLVLPASWPELLPVPLAVKKLLEFAFGWKEVVRQLDLVPDAPKSLAVSDEDVGAPIGQL
jgi:hypothetical protein